MIARIFLFAIFLTPIAVFADVVFTTGVDDSVNIVGTTGQNTVVYANLGTGLTGTVRSARVFIGTQNYTVPSTVYTVGILCYTDSGYTTACGGALSQFVMTEVAGDNTPHLVVASSTASYELSASRYYRAYISDGTTSGDNSDLMWYGVTSPDVCTTSGCTGTPWLELDDGVYDDSTRIVSVSPYDTEVTATTTTQTVTYSVYVNDQHACAQCVFEVKSHLRSDSQVSVADPNAVITTQQYILDAAGWHYPEFEIDASRVGEYQLDAAIHVPTYLQSWLNVVGLSGILVSDQLTATTTRFIASHQNAFDTWMASTTDAIATYAQSLDYDSCIAWTALDLQECLRVLFIPSNDAMGQLFADFRANVLGVVPFGYVTRFVEILLDDNVEELPAFTFDIPDIGTSLDGGTYTFDVWSWFYQDGSPVHDQIVSNSDNPQNFWEILEPLFTTVVYLFVLYMIINDLIGIFGHNSSTHVVSTSRKRTL